MPASVPPPAPPRSPRTAREVPSSPHAYPLAMKRRGSLTRLGSGQPAGVNGAAASPHQTHQRRGSSGLDRQENSGGGGGGGSANGSASSSGGGTLGRNKNSSASGGCLLDPYELSEDMKEHEVERLERKYCGRDGLMTPHRAARVIQRNFREYVFKKQFEMLRTERRPNRRLEHLQRSTSMLVDSEHPLTGGAAAERAAHANASGGILSRALKQANSFEDVLLERAYSTCWTSSEGAEEGRTAGATTAGDAKSAGSTGGGSRDSGVDADGAHGVGGVAATSGGHLRDHAPPSHSTSTTSMNSAATEGSSGASSTASSSSSGISSTTAATVVIKAAAGPHLGAPGTAAWRQAAPGGPPVWQPQAGEVPAVGPLHGHHHQCSCQHHHHHTHHHHPAHQPRPARCSHAAPPVIALPTPAAGGHRGSTGSGHAPSSTPSPASSASSVLSRDKFHHQRGAGIDTPPGGAAHPHSVSSERKRKRMYRVGLHIFNK